MISNELVYDVGVNDGADSAYYLFRGYRVVGIEASPVLADKLRAKFAEPIQDGRYILLDIGVAEEDGSAEFWMSDVTEWSSFNQAIAGRNGTPHRAVPVTTRQFSSIIEQFGTPLYCKVDIEGNDQFCLTGFTADTAPRYLSIEMSHRDGGSHLDLLYDLGYRDFKIISQVTRAEAMPWLTKIYGAVPDGPKKALRAAVKLTAGVMSVDGWRFPWGSSGAFGEDTPGAWHTLDETKKLWSILKDIDERAGASGLGEWFDFHVRR